MTDWRTMVVDLVLTGDGIDDGGVKVLRKHLYENGAIDRKGVDFLVDLRNRAQRKAKGTPVSPTLLGRLYNDSALLAFASAYQQATGFHQLHPPGFE